MCFSCVRVTTKSDYWLPLVCLSVCPSVHMQQLVYSWMDFIEIEYGACAFHAV